METVPVLLLSCLAVGYFVLAGCDIGLGMLVPYLTRTPAERRRLVSAIAPYFLGTEVWLVAAVGVVAGLFPALKGLLFGGGLWAVFSALLAGWLFRDAGLWFRARLDAPGWRAACDTAVTAGSWVLATTWGLVLGGLLSGGDPLSPVALACAVAVTVLFLLRGAAFGAGRLVPPHADSSGPVSSADTATSADEAARLTRPLARIGLGAVAVAFVLAVAPALLPTADPITVDRPLAAAAITTAIAGALAATSGLSGPHLSRHTSALAIGTVPVLVGLALDLPLAAAPPGTLHLIGTAVLPLLPLMLVGQTALYRMLRRPASEQGFFASPLTPASVPPFR
ncbi:cytochrome bd-type quinol oxidase subunit 2 [Nocardiopsis mwathae]|uniref:Cytochrome bd-type quinol oxidase subunit 2 n=1 Tax=Nocardiopsis mwathae TaxID=1472723 RepID=A0A7W9YMA0_9ACTN|nr:cytochrome d ubiquinol oxidase subunit II [Nocardiopsis mwathae]MBB6174667.1 cytochrome bd-type quinol oxidase subunit 2 [Nocardiopsis mwathae]